MARSWSPASAKSETRLKRSYKEGIGTHHGTRGWGWRLEAGIRSAVVSALGGLQVRLKPTLMLLFQCRVPIEDAGRNVRGKALRLVRRKVPLPCANAQIPAVFAGDLQLHLPPKAVGLFVGRHVPDDVLRANLGDDFFV